MVYWPGLLALKRSRRGAQRVDLCKEAGHVRPDVRPRAGRPVGGAGRHPGAALFSLYKARRHGQNLPLGSAALRSLARVDALPKPKVFSRPWCSRGPCNASARALTRFCFARAGVPRGVAEPDQEELEQEAGRPARRDRCRAGRAAEGDPGRPGASGHPDQDSHLLRAVPPHLRHQER